MGDEISSLDFVQLEKDLHAALDSDIRHQRENDAKYRAVAQRVSSYEEFRELVRGAHLRPLEKGEKLSNGRCKQSLWNSLAMSNKRRSNGEYEYGQSLNTSPSPCPLTPSCLDEGRLPTSSQQFVNCWRNLDIVDRLSLLQRMGPAALGHLFRLEIPVGLLGEILQTLLAFSPSTGDIVCIVGLLEALAEAKRFAISLQFLSVIERTTCKQLMEKIMNSLQDRQQDLAEEGVTEWTLQELRKKYQV